MKRNYQIKCAIDNGPYEIIESISKFIKKVGDTDSHTFTMEEKDLRDESVVYYKITGYIENTLEDGIKLQQKGKPINYSTSIYSLTQGNGAHKLKYGTSRTKKKRQRLLEQQHQERLEQQKMEYNNLYINICKQLSNATFNQLQEITQILNNNVVEDK